VVTRGLRQDKSGEVPGRHVSHDQGAERAMSVVDIHTHMLSEEYMRLLSEGTGGTFTVGGVIGGSSALTGTAWPSRR